MAGEMSGEHTDNRLARVRISASLFAECVWLPDGCAIRDVTFDANSNCLTATIEHRDLRALASGETIPLREVLCRRVESSFGDEYA